jgi:hypothetical protein
MSDEDWLPDNCVQCGAPLMGGATIHAADCPIFQIIRDFETRLRARKGEPVIVEEDGEL